MDKEKLVVKIIGWIFIVGAFAYLISDVLPKKVPVWVNEFMLVTWPTQEILPQYYENTFFDILGALIFAALIFAAGWGLLKLKPWARILASLILIRKILHITFVLLLFDPITYNIIKTLIFLSFYTILFVILFLPFIKKQFDSSIKFKKFHPLAKVAVIIVLLNAVTYLIGNFVIIFVGIAYSGAFKRIPTPAKVQYSIENNRYIEDKCSELEIFGISILLPEQRDLYAISVEGGKCILSFLFKEDDSTQGYAIISNGSFFDEMLSVYEKLGITNTYDIEKRMLKRTRLSLFQMMSPDWGFLALTDYDIIEEVTSDKWLGFVKHYRRECEERNTWTSDCSAYSKDLLRAATVSISFEEGTMTLEETKNILATLEFLEQTKTADEFFRMGKEALKKKDYNKAILNFTNALHFGPENPEYYYNIALSFHEKYKKKNKDLFLSESKEFLTYALEIDPEHKEAKKLLSLIE